MKREIIISIILLININAFAGDIVIASDTSIGSSTWTIPSTTILKFTTGGHISGTGTISGGIIQAAMTQNIFDTLLTVNPSALYNGQFSACWFGANPSNGDNSGRLQKAINTCLNKWWLIIPQGTYSFSKRLDVSQIYAGTYVGCSIHISGDGITNFWRPELGTILNYTGDSVAISLQLNKGTELDHFVLQGGWVSPSSSNMMTYYNLVDSTFTDQSGHGYGTALRGIDIDYKTNPDASNSGSTGIYIHDCIIKNFCYCIVGSLNGQTLNNECEKFQHIQFGDCKIIYVSTQGQEKGNIIDDFKSWGNVFLVFSSGVFLNGQGGDYTISNFNIAGACINLFDIHQRGWGHISIGPGFCEQIGSIGTLSTGTNLSVNNVTFDFAYQSDVGIKTLATSDNYNTTFNNCTFRYFGNTTDTLHFSGNATFNYSYFGSPYINTTGSNTVTYPTTLPVRSNIKVSVN